MHCVTEITERSGNLNVNHSKPMTPITTIQKVNDEQEEEQSLIG